MKHADLIRQLTLEEKCGLLSGRDVWSTRPVPRLKVPSAFLSDGPTGLRKQMGEEQIKEEKQKIMKPMMEAIQKSQ